MFFFVIGTLLLLAFLAWATWRTAQVLRDLAPAMNMLLLPAENALRLALIGVCIVLARVSGLPDAQFGWRADASARAALVGATVGILVAVMVPVVTRFAVARFGARIYSPIVIRSVLPRCRREWVVVPLALLPAVALEELLFRSLLLGGFGVFAPSLALAVVWSIVFGMMHAPQGVLGIVVAASLGMLLSWLFLFTQTLIAPLVAHYLINLAQLVWASRDKFWLEYDSGSRS